MSDLISRSELIKHFEAIQQEEHCVGLEFIAMIDEIKGQPTAYDVDKVIEELEEAKHEIYLYDVDLEYCQNRIDKAIEIVKQGSDANVVCEWKKIDEEGYKNCECNYDETIPDFFKYCPYCGKKIKVKESGKE